MHAEFQQRVNNTISRQNVIEVANRVLKKDSESSIIAKTDDIEIVLQHKVKSIAVKVPEK